MEYRKSSTPGTVEAKYPRQTISFKRPKQVLSLDYALDVKKDGDSPLAMHAGWSRFLLTIIDKSGEPTITPTANIPAIDASLIAFKTRSILEHKFLNRNSILSKIENEKKKGATGDVNAAAHAETFKMGNLKGKTPGEVILTMPDGLNIIKKQIEFLAANAAKFPANNAVIAACKAAVANHEAGILAMPKNKVEMPSLEKVIYDIPTKVLSKRDEEGKRFAYSIKITCDYAKDSYPWRIEIINGYANVEVQASGAQNIVGQMSRVTKSSMNLSDEEMFALVDRMDRTLTAFELTNFRTQHKLYEELAGAYKNKT